MSIPEISKSNVLSAIKQIQKKGIPPRRRSTRFCLIHDGKLYPPKYVVSLAVKSGTGHVLDPQEFGGGVETNLLLKRLGFSVVSMRQGIGGISHSGKTAYQKPLIGRVVVRGRPSDPKNGEAMLLNVLTKSWPKGLRLKFLITPGGFVVGYFPTNWTGGIGWNSKAADMEELKKHALRTLSRTVTSRVLKAAVGKVDVLTIGIDLESDEGYAELVAIYEIGSRRVYWTGKSYPTIGQERDLVQVVDLHTHLQRLGGERILVLGCHDLNMFSPRARASQDEDGARWKRCEKMRRIVNRFKPTIVLHHPHGTDSPNIWRTSWGGLTRNRKHLKAWASGIGYYNIWGEPKRVGLNEVCAKTQGGRVVDWICGRGLACICSL